MAPYGIAFSPSGNLYVTLFGSGTVDEYTGDGAAVNVPLISGLTTPLGLAIQ